MFHSIVKRLRWPLLAAAGAALILCTTTALAGSGVGGTFNLGQTNTVDAQSVLTGNPGSAAQLKVQNTGGGSALSLLVNAGVAPFKVSSPTKVPSLNADLLDGLDSTGFWKVGGNTGTTPGTNFIGTSDNKALELKVNGKRALRLEPTSSSPNLIGGSAANAVAVGAYGATIGGGGTVLAPNTVGGTVGTVAGGTGNSAIGGGSTVGGGEGNAAVGGLSTVPGGDRNTAGGASSLAAGRDAKANNDGSFVWGDVSSTADFASSANNQFDVRASGGTEIVRGASSTSPTGVALKVENDSAGTVGEAGWFRVGSANNTAPVFTMVKQANGNGDFLTCQNESAGPTFTQKCHINKYGTFVGGSDFAESLPASGDKAGYEPGDVLSIAQTGSAVIKSRHARDRALIGVYSTRPAVLGADKGGIARVGKQEIPVAITGIVPVKVTAENGPIRPGALLTSSSLLGRAMSAGPNPRIGTVLGKALGTMLRGDGVIKMLVMLR
jgi:hypothetical protein